jgi:hypothetical protein
MSAKKRTKKAPQNTGRPDDFTAGVERALRRAAKDARKTARMYGTAVYIWENGKIVAEKP